MPAGGSESRPSARCEPEHAWQRWAFDWTPRQPGEGALIARGTDAEGNVQPDAVSNNTGGYQFWATIRHPVQIVA